MAPRFVVPIVTMLVGLGLWLAYAIARAVTARTRPWSLRSDIAAAIVTGGLFVFSGFA